MYLFIIFSKLNFQELENNFYNFFFCLMDLFLHNHYIYFPRWLMVFLYIITLFDGGNDYNPFAHARLVCNLSRNLI